MGQLDPQSQQILNQRQAAPVAQPAPQAGPVYGPAPTVAPVTPVQQQSMANDAERLALSQEGQASAESNETFDRRGNLRSEFVRHPSVSSYEVVVRQLAQGLSAARNASGDQSLIVSYARMLDPNSVVREGEFATTAQADNTLGQTVARLEREFGMEGGGRLSDDARDYVISEMRNLAVGYRQAYEQQRNDYSEFARRNGIDPFEVVGEDLGAPFNAQFREYDASRLARTPGGRVGQSVGEQIRQPPADDGGPQGGGSGGRPSPTLADQYPLGADFAVNMPEEAFDREGALLALGIRPEQEQALVGLINAGARERGSQYSAQDVFSAYESAGLDPPAQEEADRITREMRAGYRFTGFGTEQLLRASEAVQDAEIERRGNNPESMTTTVGTLGSQGALIGQVDELVGVDAAISAGLRGEDITDAYTWNRDVARRQMDRSRAANPRTALVSEIGGALLTGGVRAAPAAMRAARPMLASAREGAILGGLAGFGYGEGTGGSITGAATGAAGGAVLGPVLVGSGQAIARGAGELRSAVSGARAARAERQASRSAPTQSVDAVAPGSAAEAELVSLARRAASPIRGAGARRRLQEMVQADPEIVQAAQRLGLELPADVFSPNTQLRNLTGLARSQPGTGAQAAWQNTVAESAKRVEDGLELLGATRDLTQLSDDVMRRMDSNMQALQHQGNELREGVNGLLNVQSRVDATNTQRVLAETINDLGGIKAATQAMSGPERKLLAAMGSGATPRRPTYAYMERLRREMGEAMERHSGPWADVDSATLSRYYAALASDRVDHVARELGETAADQLAASNEIFSSMYAARERMVEAFGKNLDRSIGSIIRSSISSASRDNATNIRRLMQQIPEDMRAEVAISGIVNNGMATGAGRDGFSFTRFSTAFRGLQRNGPAFRELRNVMTPEQNRFLRDLYVVSRRVADAEGRIERTGRALAPMAKAVNAEGLVQSVLSHGIPRAATSMATGVGVGATSNPLLGMAAGMSAEAAIRALAPSASRLDRVSNVISSAPFRDVLDASISGADVTGPVNRLAGSRGFVDFSRGLGLNTHRDRADWIRNALISGTTGTRTSLNDNAINISGAVAQDEQAQE